MWWIPLLALMAQSALDRGVEAFRARDLDAAIRAFEQAVREQPASARAWKFLGMAQSARSDYLIASVSLRKACELDPREESACYYLGRAEYSLNRFEESHKAFETALRLDRSDVPRLRLGMALTLEALGRDKEAEASYRTAVSGGNQQALIDLGMFLYHHGRGQEGLRYLRQANATAEIELVTRALAGSSAARLAAAPPVQVKFAASELPMVVKNGAFGDKHQVETMIAGVAVFDFDNDGWPDIFVANGADVRSQRKPDASFHDRLFRNNRDGTFTDVTDRAGLAGAGYSMGVAAGDYDNDGWVDLFVTSVRGGTLYRNRGDGTFEDVTARAGIANDGLWSVAAGWFDYDNDGRLDLFIVRYVKWDPETEPYCGLQKPGYRTYCHPKYYEGLPNRLLHNEGNGRFRDVSEESGVARYRGKGMGVSFGDFDGDGRLDVFVANDTVPNFLLHNDGNGRFTDVALDAGVAYNENGSSNSWMGAEFRDYDNDGREDIFVTALSNERFSLYRNMGGRFVETSGRARLAALSLPWSGWSLGMFDLNNDGYKDVFVAGGNVMDNAELTSSRASRQPNFVFLGEGGGAFGFQTLPGEALHRGAAFGDLDRDGRVDVVVTRLNEPPVVLRNVTSPAGHWLALRLEGTRSNRDGIGALVHVTTASGQQWNRVTTSTGYAGSSDRVVHFGLGADVTVLELEVRWQSGVGQLIRDVAADREITLTEPR